MKKISIFILRQYPYRTIVGGLANKEQTSRIPAKNPQGLETRLTPDAET
jgi:hypothetical protein